MRELLLSLVITKVTALDRLSLSLSLSLSFFKNAKAAKLLKNVQRHTHTTSLYNVLLLKVATSQWPPPPLTLLCKIWLFFSTNNFLTVDCGKSINTIVFELFVSLFSSRRQDAQSQDHQQLQEHRLGLAGDRLDWWEHATTSTSTCSDTTTTTRANTKSDIEVDDTQACLTTTSSTQAADASWREQDAASLRRSDQTTKFLRVQDVLPQSRSTTNLQIQGKVVSV